ncbi:MAG: exonuclease SbcCD subunit D, partial [Promethearchaeota archaeon]
MIEPNQFEIKFGKFQKHSTNSENTTRFIHASDIHLGSQQYRNEYRADDFIRAFEEILELGIINNVDFILLGGDVFTSLEMLPGKLIKIVNILKNFKNFTNGSILIIAIEGNHDIRKFSRGIVFERRGQSWLKFLNSLGLIILLDAVIDAPPQQMFKLYDFNTKLGGKIQIKNVMIYGTRYIGEKPINFLSKIRKAIVKKNHLFNILLQHFGIEGQMDNVPGVTLENIQHLRHRVNYLALGHFHKQFILEDWIFNPGSSEAVCSMDNSFKRGVFLVEVSNDFEKFVKKIKIIHLINRKYLWETIHLDYNFKNKKNIEAYIIDKLSSSLKYLNCNTDPSNPQIPLLYLILKGKEPSKSCKINEKELRRKICETYPILDANI